MNNYNGDSTQDIIDRVRRTTSSYSYTDDSESYSAPKPELNKRTIKKGDIYFERKTYKHWVLVEDFYGYSCKVVNTMDKDDFKYVNENTIKDMELVL